MTKTLRLLAILGLFGVPLTAQTLRDRADLGPLYTVRVTNDQLTSVRLYLRFATVRMPLGSVSGGESRCIALPPAAVNHHVAFEATNPYGTRVSDAVFVNAQRPWWEWKVRDTQGPSFLSIQPAELGCRR